MLDKDSIMSIVETHKEKLIIALSLFLVLMIIVLILIISFESKQKKQLLYLELMKKEARIPIEELFLPSNPLELPDALLYTEENSSWYLDLIERTYKNPSVEQLELAKQKAKDQFMDILESVP